MQNEKQTKKKMSTALIKLENAWLCWHHVNANRIVTVNKDDLIM